MQLQMTTPLDIGLEQQDPTLILGQDDVFDIMQAENALRRGGINDDDDTADDSDDDGSEVDGSESDAPLDSDQERERKVMGLEAELDGLYDAYRDRLRERDAKYKVMEARQKNTEREEWYGIQEDDDDGDSSVGGWDEKDGSDWLSEDSESDGELLTSPSGGRKRPRSEDDRSRNSKRPRLVTKLEGPTMPVSKAAQVCFSQDVFAGMGDVGMNEDEDEEKDRLEDEEDEDEDDMSVDDHSRQSYSEPSVRITSYLYLRC
jgi:AdoMet-dependent rRNA methyltransferase SPB1